MRRQSRGPLIHLRAVGAIFYNAIKFVETSHIIIPPTYAAAFPPTPGLLSSLSRIFALSLPTDTSLPGFLPKKQPSKYGQQKRHLPAPLFSPAAAPPRSPLFPGIA